MIRRRRRRTPIEALELRCLLATFTVTSLADNTDDDGETTLREAVIAAEAQSDADTIVFAAGLTGTIHLTEGRIQINRSVQIIGHGRTETIIDAGDRSGLFSIFQFGQDIRFESLTMANGDGSAVGGAIYVDIDFGGSSGEIVVDDVLFESNSAGAGGAIYTEQVGDEGSTNPQFTIANSTFTGNSAGSGGALMFSHGIDVTVRDSVFTSNTAGSGGAIYTENSDTIGESIENGIPVVEIERSVFVNNEAGSGGAIYGVGAMTISDSRFENNRATLRDGGGVWFDANLPSRFLPNSFEITRSTFVGNSAERSGGGIAGQAFRDQPVLLSNNTIDGNVANGTENAGGASILGADTWSIVNNTITRNTGGGIRISGRADTFISNIVAQNEKDGAGADVSIDQVTGGPIAFENNLLGTNAGTTFTPTGPDTPDDDGNLIGEDSALIDPVLGSLTDFAILSVREPLTGSPVIDRGANPAGLTTDQTGGPRTEGAAPDMGSIEGPVDTAFLEINDVSIVEGDSGTTDLVFTVTLFGSTDAPFTVEAATVDGTATLANNDYQQFDGTLNFNGTNGETRPVTVPVNGDTTEEIDETLTVRLSNVSDTNVELGDDLGLGTIIDDDSSEHILFDNGQLTILGSEGDDNIEINLTGSIITAIFNEESEEFGENEVSSIEVQGDDGDDSIFLRFVSAPATIFGAAGDDTVKGGVGPDEIRGGDGNDNLRGTRGNDTIWGGSGHDLLRGQEDNDSLIGSSGHDTLQGGSENDTLDGGAGRDDLDGGDGDDWVYGGTNNDLVDGAAGDDTVLGGAHNDTVAGGGGNDILFGDQESESAPDGNDKVRGGGGHDQLNGGGGNDTLNGDNGADTLLGGAGDDYVNGKAGQDFLDGGSGDDILHGREGDDVLIGGDGNDSMIGLTGRDIMYGGAGADTLFGNAGSDILIAGTLAADGGRTIMEHLSEDLRDEWRSGRSYTQRVANVRNGAGATANRLNSTYLIGEGRPGQNVFDDSIPDTLNGGNSSSTLDFLFARVSSDLTDKQSAEQLDAI